MLGWKTVQLMPSSNVTVSQSHVGSSHVASRVSLTVIDLDDRNLHKRTLLIGFGEFVSQLQVDFETKFISLM